MSDASKIEFENICADILNNEKFKSLSFEMHHGITRYEHSMHVAKTTFMVLKKANSKNLVEATRAALLHDFYNNKEIDELNKVERLSAHPYVALNNAKKYFKINKMQEDIIINHMFPSTKRIPKTKIGKIVSLIDKIVAVHEMTRYKFAMQLSILMLFVFNMIAIQN